MYITRDRTRRALLAGRGVISVQVLNEFVNVASRLLKRPLPAATKALTFVKALCPSIVPLTIEIHERALKIAERTGYGFFDALIIASALKSGCDTLYSEDMARHIIDSRLTIRNPFLPQP